MLKKSAHIILAICLWQTAVLNAQNYTDLGETLQITHVGDMLWGDYDADGDLDLLVMGDGGGGTDWTQIYENTGGSFTLDATATNSLPQLANSNADWGDFDGDGYLDLVLMGKTAGVRIRTAIYIYNNGTGEYEIDAAAGAGLQTLGNGTVEFGDYDNDGDLDLAQNGKNDGGGRRSRIWLNNNGVYENSGASLPQVDDGQLSWGDYDADGDLDLAIVGYTGGAFIGEIHENNGDGTFTEDATSSAQIVNVEDASIVWGDYDDDGYPDLIVSGHNSNVWYTNIYHNNSGVFDEAAVSSPVGLRFADNAWGDFDSDGDLDALISGENNSSGRQTRFYENNGGGSFTFNDQGLTNVSIGSVNLGDYDDDGDLDLALNGRDKDAGPTVLVSQIYDNDDQSNTNPNTPAGLGSSVVSSDVTLSWNAASDGETATTGLTYNIYIGTSSESENIVSSSSDVSFGDGYRYVGKFGNTGYGLSHTIEGLADGTYYWSVQTVDNNFSGSSFATEQTFTIGGGGLTAPTNLSAAAGDGFIDLDWDAVGGATSYRVYRDESAGATTLLASGVTQTNYTDATVVLGTEYFYRVTAFDGATESAYSTEVNETSFAISPVITDQALDLAAPIHNTSFEVSATVTDVDANLNEVRFIWSLNESSQTNIIMTAQGGDVYAATVPAQAGGSEIDWQIEAEDDKGNTTTTIAASFTVISEIPQNVSIVPGNEHVNLSWDDATGAVLYNVYGGTASGLETLVQSDIASQSVVINGLTNGTEYFYRVTSNNDGGESDYSTEASGTPAVALFPVVESIVYTTPVSPNTAVNIEAELTDGDDNIASGVIAWSLNDTPQSDIDLVFSLGDIWEAEIPGQISGSVVSFHIEATDDAGNTTVSSPDSSYVVLPGAISDLAASAGDGQVDLTWSAETGADSYSIYRSTTSPAVDLLASGQTGTAYNDATASNGVTYFYRMTSVNDGGESDYSNEVSATPVAALFPVVESINFTTPVAPNEVVAVSAEITDGDDSVVSSIIDWSLNGTPQGNIAMTNTSDNTWIADIPAQSAGAEIIFTIKPTDGSGNTGISDPESSYIVRPGAISDLAASAGDAQVNLTWSAETGADTYDLYRGLSSATTELLVADLTGTSFDDLTTANGTTYFYRIKAVNSGGESGFSNEVSATAVDQAPAAPTGLQAISYDGRVDLSWNENPEDDILSYRIYRLKDGEGLSALIHTTDASTTSYSDNDVINGSSYEYEITAVDNGLNEGDGSTSVTAIPGVTSPQFANLQFAPRSPLPSETVVVTVDIIDPNLDENTVKIIWALDEVDQTRLSMTNIGSNKWRGVIPTQADFIRVQFKVLASDDDDQTSLSNLQKYTVNAPPADPQNFISSINGSNKFALAWDDNSEPDLMRYRIYRNDAILDSVDAGISDWIDESASESVAYTYLLEAVDSTFLTSNTVSSVEQSIPPQAPSDPTSDAGPNAIVLYWTASPSVSAVGYNIYRGTNEGSEVLIDNVTGSITYTDGAVTKDVTYYYLVRAYDGLDAESDAVAYEIVAADENPPSSPLNFVATQGNNKIRLTWNQNDESDLEGYLLTRNGWTDPDTLFLDLDENFFVDDNVNPGTAYTYGLWAKDRNENASGGVSVSATAFDYPQTFTYQANSAVFPTPVDSTNYRMVSLPGNDAINVDAALNGEFNTVWKAYFENGITSNNQKDYLTIYNASNSNFRFLQGRGFWVLTSEGWNASTLADAGQTAPLADSLNTSIQLHPGWNIIGNPFIANVLWSDIQRLNPTATQSIYSWNGSSYQSPTQLKPYEGYYYFNDTNSPLVQLIIPHPSATAISASKTAEDLNETTLLNRLTISVSAVNDATSSITIGRHENALISKDKFDRYAPPAGFASVSLMIKNPKVNQDYQWLSADVRADDNFEGETYNLVLKAPANSTQAFTIDLDGFSGDEIRLVNTLTGQQWDLTSESEFGVNILNDRTEFIILTGDLAFVDAQADTYLPAIFDLQPNYPNPFNPSTVISYTIPDEVSEVAVRLEIYNVLGQLVDVLVDQTQQAGFYQVRWDTDNRMASGLYLYRFTAGGFTKTHKMMLVR